MTTDKKYDFIVIGAGSGGVRAARIAASHGARVALIEKSYIGGTCVNLGCVPKKFLSYGAMFGREFQDAPAYGWKILSGEDAYTTKGGRKDGPVWSVLRDNIQAEINRLRGIYAALLKDVDIYHGHGRLKGGYQVAVEDGANTQALRGEKILLATGSRPFVPEIKGCAHFIISDDVFSLPQLPSHVTIYGGGYIAAEFASILSGLGANVTLCYRGSLFLRHFDSDIRLHLAEEMRRAGVEFRFGCEITSVEKAASSGFSLMTKDGDVLETDLALAATGRRANIDGLGIETCGIELGANGLLKVNEVFSTEVSHVYAIGDLINKAQLTPIAIAQGHYLADKLFAAPNYTHREKPDEAIIPTAVFTDPPVSTVGLTEDEAEEKFGAENIVCYSSAFRPMKFSLSGRESKSLMKLVAHIDSDKILGIHMAGLDAPEIMQGFALALQQGATKRDFDKMIGIHPTSAEEFVTMRTPSKGRPDIADRLQKFRLDRKSKSSK